MESRDLGRGQGHRDPSTSLGPRCGRDDGGVWRSLTPLGIDRGHIGYPMATAHDTHLGIFLKARRARLDPTALGFGAGRRRTPGLRREEVAQRANVSAT